MSLNVHATCEHKGDDIKNTFYEELERAYRNFPKHDINVLLRDLIEKVGREYIFKLTMGNEVKHETSNDNVIRVVNFTTYENLVVKSIMFPRRDTHKNTSGPLMGEKCATRLINFYMRGYSIIIDIRCFVRLIVIPLYGTCKS
jgi:hypothetical protein